MSGVGLNKLTNSKSITTLSPTMNSFAKLHNFKQFNKPAKIVAKGSSKSKVISKRKNKSKNVSKGYDGNLYIFTQSLFLLDSKYRTTKNKQSKERAGFQIISRNTFLEVNQDKPHNSSLEEYNTKGKISTMKMAGHRRSNMKVNIKFMKN